jgi:hypothetical protein
MEGIDEIGGTCSLNRLAYVPFPSHFGTHDRIRIARGTTVKEMYVSLHFEMANSATYADKEPS